MALKKQDIYFWSSLVLAVWFALTSSLWTYYANLFISLPFGILSFLLWRIGKKQDTKTERYKATAAILIIGVVLSLAVLVYYLIWE